MNATDTVSPVIREFASRVRAALDDLSPDEIDDLTEGLEADLSEQQKDAGDDFRLGDPVAYSEELRTSAGLGPREERRRFEPIARLRQLSADVTRRVRSTATGSALLDFAIVFRPVWWLLRAWTLFHVMAGIVSPWNRPPLPQSLLSWVALIALVVVSVQWGRGRWLKLRGLPTLKVVASTVAVLALPAIISNVTHFAGQQDVEYYAPQGLTMNGQEVRNIFAYDAEGEPLENVQLFTQDGQPLITAWDSANSAEPSGVIERGEELNLIPNARAGESGWGVYPLRQVKSSDLDWSTSGSALFDRSDVVEASPPFERTRPLASDPTAQKKAGSAREDSAAVPEEPTVSPSPSPIASPMP